jgi:hypothetical protein
MKKQQYQATAIVIVLLVVGWLIFNNKSTKAPVIQTENNTTTTPSPAPAATKAPAPASTGTVWEGILKESNNSSKGNLMLETKDRTIYLRTSRDFSALIGKEVKVTYEGTLESFVLGDIEAK